MNFELDLNPKEKKVADFIQKHQLLEAQNKVLVAVSGGKDSVAVTHILKQLGYDLEVAHVNFGLRGSESDEDALFVKALAQNLNIKFHTITFDTVSESKQGESIQMTARRLRYEWFHQLARETGISNVVTAHSANDNAETILYNLSKGTGLDGMVGIPLKNGLFKRPLLCLSSQEILEYISERQISFREDRSNASDKYARNKIRHYVIPTLESINRSFVHSMMNHSERFAAITNVYHQSIQDLKAKYWQPNTYGYWVFNTSALPSLMESDNLFVEWLRPLGFDPELVKAFKKDGISGASIVSEHFELIRTSDALWLGKRNDEIVEEKTIPMEPSGLIETTLGTLSWERIESVSKETLTHTQCAFLNPEKLEGVLTLAHTKTADRFRPLGMPSGSQLISDFMTNLKMSLPEKRAQLLIKEGERVVWVVGKRIDERFRVHNMNTTCIRFKWSKKTKSPFPFI